MLCFGDLDKREYRSLYVLYFYFDFKRRDVWKKEIINKNDNHLVEKQKVLGYMENKKNRWVFNE